MRRGLCICLLLVTAACAQREEEPPTGYYANPYEEQLGAPQRMTKEQFRQNVRQDNPRPITSTDSRYGETAVRSSMNIMQTFSKAIAAGN